MSRIGKIPVIIPNTVKVVLDDDSINVDGPRGSLSQVILKDTKVKIEDQKVIITRINDQKLAKSNHGLMRSLIFNMVYGVNEGFFRKLEINGVGYKTRIEGNNLILNVGFSHEVIYPIPEDIKVTTDQNIISISGISKQNVGQVASEIRSIRKPEPYKGKGIKYIDEKIIRKSGKSNKEK